MSEEAVQNNTELTDEQVNDLYEKINSPSSSSNIPDSHDPGPREWELAEGVKASEEDLLNYAKKGYESAQTMEAFNKEKEQFFPVMDKYKQIDEYAIQNPEWWEHVQNSYGNREQSNDTIGNELTSQDSQQELSPELQAITNQLNEVREFIHSQKSEQERKQMAEDDSLLDAEINSIKEQHAYMDFGTPDEKGVTLEQKVLKHAQEIGTQSFRVAFRDYAHDKLISKAEELGKEAIGKDIQRKTKLGILGSSTKSSSPKLASGYNKKKSYEDLAREAIEELGIK